MLSKEFLLSRGYCCGNGCFMCPYEPKHIKDNRKVRKTRTREILKNLKKN